MNTIPATIFFILLCSIISTARLTIVDKLIPEKTEGLIFHDSIGAIESVLPIHISMKIYTGDLAGYVTILDGQDRENLKIISRKKVAAGYCTGIVASSRNELYIGISDGIGNWGKQKCFIIRTDSLLTVIDTIAGPDILINGITVDPNDNIYFATGEFALLFPKKGMIRKISCKNSCSEPEIIVDNCKRPNGLFFDTTAGKIFFTETLNGVRSFNTMTKTKNTIVKNKRFFDASDDLCIDKSGGIWIANPPNGFVKYYEPGKERITYFKSNYFGAASACRIRWEEGEEILYISEIRNPKGEYNGRGLISIPVEVLKKMQ